MKILMTTAKKRLAIIWFPWFAILFLLLLVQSLLGRYEDKATEAWSWFAPTILPSLSLMISVFFADALKMSKEVQYVDKFLYGLAIFLSILYLLAVSITILAAPFSKLWPLELMKRSNMYLGLLQGLVAGTLMFFFRQKGLEEG